MTEFPVVLPVTGNPGFNVASQPAYDGGDVLLGLLDAWNNYDASNDRPCVAIEQSPSLQKKQIKLVQIDDTRSLYFSVRTNLISPGPDILSVYLLYRDSNGNIFVGATQLAVDGDVLGFDADLVSSTQAIVTYTDNASGDLEGRIVNFSGNDITTIGAANTLVSTYTNTFSSVASSSSTLGAFLYDNGAGELWHSGFTVSGDTITVNSSGGISATYVNAKVTTLDTANDGLLFTYAQSAGGSLVIQSRRRSGGLYIPGTVFPLGSGDFGPNDVVVTSFDIGGVSTILAGIVYSDATSNDMEIVRVIFNNDGTIGSTTALAFETSSQSQVAAALIQGETILAVYEDDSTVKSSVIQIFNLSVESTTTNQTVDVEPDSLDVVSMGVNFLMRSQIVASTVTPTEDNGEVCMQSVSSFSSYTFYRYVLDRDQSDIIIPAAMTKGTETNNTQPFGKNYFWLNGWNAQDVNPAEWISTVTEQPGIGLPVSDYDADRGVSDANSVEMQTSAMYFSDDIIESKQFVEVAIGSGATTNTAALATSVDLSKAFMVWNGARLSAIDGLDAALANIEFDNASAIRSSRTSSGTSTTTTRAMIIDPNEYFVEKREVVTGSMAGTASDSVSLSQTFVPERTLSVWNNQLGDTSGNPSEVFVRAELQSSGDTVVFDSNTSSAFDQEPKLTLIQFAASALNQDIQRGSVTLNATELTKDIPIIPVRNDTSLFNWVGFTSDLTSVSEDSLLAILELVDVGLTGMFNNIRITRLASSGSITYNTEVADFKGL